MARQKTNQSTSHTTRRKSSHKAPHSKVADALYQKLKERGENPVYPALIKRVMDILEHQNDPAEVELVCSTIIDDSHDFSAWKDFNYVWYEYTKDSLEVPDGAWQYALWAYQTHDSTLKTSLNYWLGEWYDADFAGDAKKIKNAQEQLEKLVNFAGDSDE